MGILDLGYATSDREVTNPLQTVPSTPGERFGADFSAAFAEDRYFTKPRALVERANRVIDDIHGATGERLLNPYEIVPTPEEMRHFGNESAIRAERLLKLRQKANALRSSVPLDEASMPTDYLDTNFEEQVARDATARRVRAEELSGTGSGWAAFGGSMLGETFTPHGLLSLAIPVTRLPTAASMAIGQTFLSNVVKEGVFQAGTNMALQGAAETLDYASRRGSGTEQTAGEIATNIAGAGAFSAVIGSSARALHLKWLGLPESVRAKAPNEVKDAFRVIEGESLYAGGNRFGLPPDVHEKMMERAVNDVMLGKPVQGSDIWGTADTSMTALRRVLRGQDTAAPNITGLWDAIDMVGKLPDPELESFARQLKPRSFIAHDRLTREISTAKAELAGMNRNLEAVTAADIVDPLTGARLADIDVRLGAKGLPARERVQLERERDMIIQSVDTDGTLAKNLERERASLETDAEKKKRVALEARIEKAEAELVYARGEVTREVDFLREKLERLGPKFRNAAGTGTPFQARDVAKDLGVSTVDDLAGAAGRAESRAAPVIPPRERLPEPKAPEQEAAPDPAFEKKLRDETERVWLDKDVMGGSRRNVRRNEDFAREVARENIMRNENPNDLAIVIQKHDLTPEMVREISALYRRGVGEKPQDAFSRAFNRWSDADEAEAIKFFGQLQEDLEFDPLARPSGDKFLDAVDEMFGNLNRYYGYDDFDHSKIPFDGPTMQLEADQRAQAFLNEPRAKPDDPELVKAQDLETQRVIDNPAVPEGLRAEARRELAAADLEVKDANAAAACATSGAHL